MSANRASVNRGDRGYDPGYAHIEVTLDGVKLQNCVTADEALGEAICYTGFTQDGGFGHETKRGVVKIIYLPGHPKAQ